MLLPRLPEVLVDRTAGLMFFGRKDDGCRGRVSEAEEKRRSRRETDAETATDIPDALLAPSPFRRHHHNPPSDFGDASKWRFGWAS